MTVGELRTWLADKPEHMPVWLCTTDVEAPIAVAEINHVMTAPDDDRGTIRVVVLHSDETPF